MWLIILGLLVLTGSGVVTGPWLVLCVLLALAAPALILRNQRPIGVTTTSRKRTTLIPDEHDRSLLGLGGTDVYRWENEGGARATYVSGRVRDPANAVP
jgi:hypothetical protein